MWKVGITFPPVPPLKLGSRPLPAFVAGEQAKNYPQSYPQPGQKSVDNLGITFPPRSFRPESYPQVFRRIGDKVALYPQFIHKVANTQP